MSWIEIALPAAIGAITSFLVAVLTIRHQHKRDIRNLQSKMQSELNEWKLKFAELSSGDITHARAVAQQIGVGVLIVETEDPKNSPTLGESGRSREKYFVPRDASITIGRGEDAYIQVNDPSASKTHAMVESVGEKVFLRSLHARSTYINGQKMAVDTHEFSSGDLLQIGDTRIFFQAIS